MEQLLPPLPKNIEIPEKPPTTPRVKKGKPDMFVEKFLHIQEDLKYMFQIEVANEDELRSDITKQKIYTRAIEDLRAGNPFSLEHLEVYKLISPSDIKKDDLPGIKTSALKILKTYKHTARLAASKELFLKMEILTEDEMRSDS